MKYPNSWRWKWKIVPQLARSVCLVRRIGLVESRLNLTADLEFHVHPHSSSLIRSRPHFSDTRRLYRTRHTKTHQHHHRHRHVHQHRHHPHPNHPIFSPETCPPFAPTYSQVSIIPISPTTKLITLAGQIATSKDGFSTPLSFPDQVRSALSNVDKCLTAAGATKANIFAVRQYVVGLGKLSDEDKMARWRIYTEWLGDGMEKPPPSTLVGVESLAGRELLFEVEVQAVVFGS